MASFVNTRGGMPQARPVSKPEAQIFRPRLGLSYRIAVSDLDRHPMKASEQEIFRNSAAGAMLAELLREAVEVDNAAFGNIQVFNSESGGLEIIVHQGFDPDFLQLFKLVMPDDSTVCARAYRLASRISIADISNDPHLLPYLSQLRAIGFQAVQSTPILDTHGCVIGMLSTHFAQPHYLSKEAEQALDACAQRAAELLQQFLSARRGI